MKAVNVRPITELKNRTKALIREVVEGGQTVVITQNGKPRVVVMDVAEHDRLHAYFTHRDRRNRRIVITETGDGDRLR